MCGGYPVCVEELVISCDMLLPLESEPRAAPAADQAASIARSGVP
jgi:hypothetical protein